ncbi:MAG: ATP-binding protein [Proteobacteria bacterium]|nr:ATP-binding protein [Pseudomonadota bacterium]
MSLRTPAPLVRADGPICQAVFDPPDWICPECHDRGGRISRDEGGYEVFSACSCLKARRRLEMFNSANIGKRFVNATLGTYKPKTKIQAAAQMKAEQFALQYPSVEHGLLFYGPVGTGKTHLVVAIFRELTLRKGVGCRFIDYGNLLQDLRRSYADKRGDGYLMMPLVNVELLVIDELGKGRGTEWEETVLDDLISRRYNAGRTTLCTTNFDPTLTPLEQEPSPNQSFTGRELRAAGTRLPSLSERIGERIYSRLCAMAEFVEVDGGDYRRGQQAGAGPRNRR